MRKKQLKQIKEENKNMDSFQYCTLQEPPKEAKAKSLGNSRKKRALVHYSKTWPSRSTLKIAFMDNPTPEHKKKIIAAAERWLPYISLKFEFVEGAEGHIRISTEGVGNSSFLGTDALEMFPDTPTMWLGIDPEHEDFETVVTHEFGHALGAMHEHQHPKAQIPWNKENVYNYYQNRPLHPLSPGQVDDNIFTPFNDADALYLPYDRKSIMHHPISNNLTLGNWANPINREISEKDKELMRLIYPR
ncbi:M12 family metallopeptidase [Pseudomonas sp. HOU2]|uniref:M12 family metallopeptidase n=1 Tax=Pseudomonas sp. HOU2 TaxID=3230301 RepID=UPI00345A4755